MTGEDRKLNVKRVRIAGVLVTATLLAAFLLILRLQSPAPPPEAAPSRGGQVVAAIHDDPSSFNPLIGRNETTEILSALTQGRLVRLEPPAFLPQPWLAESWESSGDGRVYTLRLRSDLTWSDGVPFTSADVEFSVRAAYSGGVEGTAAARLTAGRQPVRIVTPDARTVVVTFPSPTGAGLGLLGALPILPRHKLEGALAAGTFASSWSAATPVGDIAGTGPFLVREYQAGRRIVLERNPRYWRRAPDGGPLPYLDRIELRITPRGTALPAVLSGGIDLPLDELGRDEYPAVRPAEEEGRLRVIELGVSTDPDAFWFCLKPEVKASDARFGFLNRPEFRQAISHALDRESFAQSVFQGEAVPIWGPITPGNPEWFWPDVLRYPPDASRARQLLAGIGLEDRNGNGTVEDARGTEARFTVLTERGVDSRERGLAVLRESLRGIGIVAEVEPLDAGDLARRISACEYDAVYHRSPAASLDPAADLDFWLSAGPRHAWNPGQRTPGTDWERRIDTLMLEQAATLDPERRRQQFILVQRALAEQLPILYFAAPRLYYAHHPRVRGLVPSVQRPYVLWNGDLLQVAP